MNKNSVIEHEHKTQNTHDNKVFEILNVLFSNWPEKVMKNQKKVLELYFDSIFVTCLQSKKLRYHEN